MGLIKNYYAGGNTNVGFYSIYEDNFRGLDHLYILKGGPGTGKSTLIRKIGESLNRKGYTIHFFHCSSDNDSLDGVIIPDLKLGIVDGTAPHIVDPVYPGAVDKIVNLGDFWDEQKLRENRRHIMKLTDDIAYNFKEAYAQLAEAKLIHDEWEEIYLAAIDFQKADKVTERLMELTFDGNIEQEESPKTKRLFFGAATPKGAVNFIENITQNLKKRYIIKGRPGSGKSTLMKRIGKKAENLGLSVEYYPCGFDPNSLDMIIIPSLSVGFVDGTAPHVINPSRENDEVFDMFALCIDTDVERIKGKELQSIEQRYKIKMTIGTNHLKEAKRLHDMLESYYIDAMDFVSVNQKKEAILQEILQLTS